MIQRNTIFTLSVLLTFFCLPPFFGTAHAQPSPEKQRELILKSGVIYNFTKFIKWPEKAGENNPERNFIFCVNGDSHIADIFKSISRKRQIQGRNIEVRSDVPAAKIKNCHILFLGSSKSGNLEKTLGFAKEHPVLTISDSPGFAKRGVSINLAIINNKIRFEINLRSIAASRLKVSSELLQLGILIAGGD